MKQFDYPTLAVILILIGIGWYCHSTLDRWAIRINQFSQDVNTELLRLNKIQQDHAIKIELLLKNTGHTVYYDKETNI